MRRLRVLGSLLTAALALAAVGASGAHASFFTAEAYPATVTGEREPGQVALEVNGISAECGVATLHGTLSEA